MSDLVAVGIGGFVGAVARYLVGGWAAARLGTLFPYGTFIINVTGCFILGFLMGGLERDAIPAALRLPIGVGFVGAYTTFSTYSYETLHLVETGSTVAAAWNVVGSNVVGLLSALTGLAAGRAL
jgi:CrcB protein